MAREGLRRELNDAFRKALRQKGTVALKNVVVRTDGGTQSVDIIIQPVAEPEALRGMILIVFTDVPTPPETRSTSKTRRAPAQGARAAELERELEQIRHEVGTTRERAQIAQEELKSANEELQSTNEELQSTNEELTTSEEEMQSMNEELQMVNQELSIKVDELSRLNNDMKNLLDSTDIATLFLDSELRVRFFTIGSNRIFKLIPADVGRPITDIASELLYPELGEAVRDVIRMLVVHERQVATRDGRWFMVRIMPYRTLENMIDGVVITFTDITDSKTREAELRKTQAGLEERVAEQATELDKAGGKAGTV